MNKKPLIKKLLLEYMELANDLSFGEMMYSFLRKVEGVDFNNIKKLKRIPDDFFLAGIDDTLEEEKKFKEDGI